MTQLPEVNYHQYQNPITFQQQPITTLLLLPSGITTQYSTKFENELHIPSTFLTYPNHNYCIDIEVYYKISYNTNNFNNPKTWNIIRYIGEVTEVIPYGIYFLNIAYQYGKLEHTIFIKCLKEIIENENTLG